jgi:uncharacterized protein
MRVFLFFLCCLLLNVARPAVAETPLDHLTGLKGDYFPYQSSEVGRSFHIYVRLPPDYTANPAKKYPVVYLLDGDTLFPILATNHLFLHFDENLPEAIVVGIAYGSFDPAINRRDYDFSAPAEDAKANEGGAPAFQAFLKKELLPTIESKYRADTERRVLFGNSRGGYFVLWSAFTDPDLFWGRIVSNPSLDPGRKLFFAAPKAATLKDLGLVFSSGTRDRPKTRNNALDFAKAWDGKTGLPWRLNLQTIEGGTHAADHTNVYRKAMLWLFAQP